LLTFIYYSNKLIINQKTLASSDSYQPSSSY